MALWSLHQNKQQQHPIGVAPSVTLPADWADGEPLDKVEAGARGMVTATLLSAAVWLSIIVAALLLLR